MKVLFIGVYKDGTGWGNAAQNYILALDAAGVDVVPRAIKLNDRGAEVPQRILQLEKKSTKGCDYVIQNVLPHHMEYEGLFKKNIGIYFTETSHFKNSGWPQKLNMMDELWVCNEQMKDAANESGVSVPMHTVHVPAHIDKYKRQYEKIDLGIEGSFSFYFIGEVIRRKNLVSLLKAFHLEFTTDEPVELVIKGNLSGMSEEETKKHIEEMCNQVKINLKLYPDLCDYKEERIVTRYIDNDSLLKLHRSCDCFVAPSFGEAWCIPAFDAMCMGNTPIVNNCTGLVEFVNQENGWVVSNSEEPVFGMTQGFSDLYVGNEDWWNINIKDLRRCMREAYEGNRSDKIGSCMQKREEFSYKSVGNRMKELLNA
jgi:glycosyltransferase involved in cell wall biosynthesis